MYINTNLPHMRDPLDELPTPKAQSGQKMTIAPEFRVDKEDIQLAKTGKRDTAAMKCPLPKALVINSHELKDKAALDLEVSDLESSYRVEVEDVARTVEFWSVIENASEEDAPTVIVIRAHGSHDMMFFGDDEEIDASLCYTATPLSKLPKGVTIVLNSCKNGQGGKRAQNIANLFAKFCPQATIISSTTSVSSYSFRVVNLFPLSVKFYSLLHPLTPLRMLDKSLCWFKGFVKGSYLVYPFDFLHKSIDLMHDAVDKLLPLGDATYIVEPKKVG